MRDSNSYIVASQSIEEKKYWLNKIDSDWERTIIEPDKKTNDQNVDYDELNIELSDEFIKSINKLSGESITKLQIILTASLATFLTKYLSKSKITIGTSIDKQEKEANFINTILPLCFNIDKDKTFKDILLQSRDIVKQALQNQNFPLSVIATELDIKEFENTFFDIGIILENIHDSKYITDSSTSIVFSFNRDGDDFSCKVIFNKFKYSLKAINYLTYLYIHLFERLVSEINQEISNLELLPEKDLQELISEQNNQTYNYPLESNIIEHIKNQFESKPDKVAIGFNNSSITFREIDERSNIIANELIKNNINSEEIIAILLDRSLEVVTSMLGVLKAGCAYVPIEIDTPVERINYILNDCDCKIVISDSSNNLPFSRNELISKIHIDIQNISQPETKDVKVSVNSEQPAYLIYTSGSTGNPKGVLMSHKSVVNFMFGMYDKTFGKYDTDNVLGLVSPFIFDASVQLTYGALMFGYKLQVLSNYERANSNPLLKCIEKYNVNILDGTPIHLDLLVSTDFINDVKFDLKHIIIGGDVLRKTKVIQLYDKLNCIKPKITNVYGPTECCVNATYNELSAETINEIEEINIGRALPNYKTYILDQDLNICPLGVKGELYIGGASLALKYMNNDKLSKEKFIENPFCKDETLYKTGDIGKLTFNKEIDFIGRCDNQIKIRGYRIELGEIEKNMISHPEIKDAVCLLKQDGDGDKKIYSFYTGNNKVSIKNIKEFLVQKIPHYMIPSFIIQIDELPIKPNGKIDKNALLDHFSKLYKDREYKLPGNEIETKLYEIWIECMKLERISIDDSFFNIGGDSIKSIYLLDKVNKKFKFEFKIADIYQNDTIEKFAQLVSEKSSMSNNEKEEIKEIKDNLETFKNDALSQL